jgi:type IV secretion system protein VirB9
MAGSLAAVTTPDAAARMAGSIATGTTPGAPPGMADSVAAGTTPGAAAGMAGSLAAGTTPRAAVGMAGSMAAGAMPGAALSMPDSMAANTMESLPAPAGDISTPTLAPDPDTSTPGQAPGLDTSTPARAPSPEISTPARAPDPSAPSADGAVVQPGAVPADSTEAPPDAVGERGTAPPPTAARVFGLFSANLSPAFPADHPAFTLLAARGAAAAAPASAPSQQATATPPATLPAAVPFPAASTAPEVTADTAGGSATTAAPAESAAHVPESGPHTTPHRSAAAAAPPPAPAPPAGSAASEPPSALPPATPPDLDPESLARSYQRTGSAPTVEIAGHGGGTVTLVAFGHGRPVLRCAPLRACAVELEPGELVLATSLGDAERWLVQSAAAGPGARTPLLVVKPTACDLSTNLVIATDRRIYEMALDSPPCHGADGGEGGYNPHLPYTGLVRFYYPDELVRRWRDEERMAREMEAERSAGRVPLAPSARLARLNFDYAWDRGRKLPWAPTQVFDDGEHTYLVLAPTAPLADLPVLMAVETDGSLALVSYHLEGQTLVADRVLEHAVLMVGPAGHGRGKDQQRLDITNRSFNRRPAEGGGR